MPRKVTKTFLFCPHCDGCQLSGSMSTLCLCSYMSTFIEPYNLFGEHSKTAFCYLDYANEILLIIVILYYFLKIELNMEVSVTNETY